MWTAIYFAISILAPVASAFTVSPRALTLRTSCNILVINSSKNLGYISPTWNEFGEYGALQTSKTRALEVRITYSWPGSAKQLNIAVVNSPDKTFPMFGAVAGFSTSDTDFKTGSLNYAYLAGTTQIASGSRATSGPSSFTSKTHYDVPFQSAIWRYDSGTGSLTPQWVNSDSSVVNAHILYANDEKTLFIAGDPAAFSNATGTSYPEVTFKCVTKLL